MGQVYGAMAALPHLKHQGGALIHVSSVEARRALPYHSAYAASKHGIKVFLESLRVELRHEKLPISVTNIMPASIKTPLFNKSRTKLGVKPQGLPIYQPKAVADAILYAAEHPIRHFVVGEAGQAISFGQALSPRLMDALMRLVGFQLQKTDEPNSEAPDNLFEPIAGFDRVAGDFSSRSRMSYSTWLAVHPTAKWGIAATAIVVELVILATQFQQQKLI